jgi:hypothetical protein
MNYLMTDTEGQNKQMEFAGQFLGKFNIKASMVNKGHTSTELGIKSSKAQVESRNKKYAYLPLAMMVHPSSEHSQNCI